MRETIGRIMKGLNRLEVMGDFAGLEIARQAAQNAWRNMDVAEYIDLIESYTKGHISPSEFESRFLRMFKEEKRIPPPQVYQILNKLFTDVDAYCSDPALRNQSSI